MVASKMSSLSLGSIKIILVLLVPCQQCLLTLLSPKIVWPSMLPDDLLQLPMILSIHLLIPHFLRRRNPFQALKFLPPLGQQLSKQSRLAARITPRARITIIIIDFWLHAIVMRPLCHRACQ